MRSYRVLFFRRRLGLKLLGDYNTATRYRCRHLNNYSTRPLHRWR
jgi:hypothetical protein